MFDEMTSNLDTGNEAELRTLLRLMTGERTVIAITHRLSLIQDVDNIIVINNGEVVAQGTHDALINVDPTYTQLRRGSEGTAAKATENERE